MRCVKAVFLQQTSTDKSEAQFVSIDPPPPPRPQKQQRKFSITISKFKLYGNGNIINNYSIQL